MPRACLEELESAAEKIWQTLAPMRPAGWQITILLSAVDLEPCGDRLIHARSDIGSNDDATRLLRCVADAIDLGETR